MMKRGMATAALLALCAGSAIGAEPVNLRVAWITTPSSLAPLIAEKPGLAQHLDKSYRLEPVHFTGTTPMITALAAGDLDIAELSYSSFGYAVQNARMEDLKVIADEVQDAVDGYYASEFMVLKDGPIKTVEDLKGKVLATNVIGAGLDIGMRAMLRRHGLEEKRDYTVIEGAYPNMKALLLEHKADLVPAIVAFSREPELRAAARTLFTQREAYGVTQILALAARAPFIAKNRAALVDFLEDELRAVRWYRDPANRTEAIEIVARVTKRPAVQFASWVFTTGDMYRDPSGMPNLEAMQRNLDTQKEFGFLKGEVDVKKHADLGPVTEAASRLK